MWPAGGTVGEFIQLHTKTYMTLKLVFYTTLYGLFFNIHEIAMENV